MRRRRRASKRKTRLLKASKILVSLGASVNLTPATGGERYGHFRSGGEGARRRSSGCEHCSRQRTVRTLAAVPRSDISLIYGRIDKGSVMTTAKLFWSGRSQAVRLPKEFRLSGEQVRIWRHGNAVILEPLADDWSWLDTVAGRLDDDFVRAVEEQPQDRPALDELFGRAEPSAH